MENLNGPRLLVFILALAVLLGGAGLLKGGFFVDQHEGDMLHLIDIVMRMSDGQVPHIDFVTPLGSLAFVPFSILVQHGFGIGNALIVGQIAFTLLILPMVWWVAWSRLNTVQGYVLATAAIVTSLAFIYGGTDPYVSMSMHYNRWAWALAFIAVPVAVFRPRTDLALVDGLILAVAMAFFTFGKITYAVALAPGLIVALALTRQWKALIFGIIGVLIVAAVLTFLEGRDVWLAYFRDLKLVSGTDIRPRAGESWMSLLFSPKFILAHTVLVAAIIYLRQGTQKDLGAMLAIFAPGFAFIAYQNYGNDPKWLVLVAIMMLAAATDMKRVALAGAAILLIAPSFVNMAFSPFRHALINKTAYVPAFKAGTHDDFHTIKTRDHRIQIGQPFVFEDDKFSGLNALANRPEFINVDGLSFPPCLLQLGLLTSMRSIAADLDTHGYGDKRIFTADTFGSFWLFGDQKPLAGAAPWYYGGLTGFVNADYVLVPVCAVTPRAVKSALKEIEAKGVTLRAVHQTELYVLFEKLN